MSSQDSLQAQSNTFGGTKSRKGIVMDLFDHGPVLMVIGGQLIKVDSLSISFELFNSIVGWVEGSCDSITHNAISVSLDTESNFKHCGGMDTGDILLFNNKHKIVFEEATISSYHRDGEDTELTFEAEDYTPSVDWNSQFA